MATIPATATAQREIALENLTGQHVGTLAGGGRLHGEARGDGFFYFTLHVPEPYDCRLPIQDDVIKVEFREQEVDQEA